jgi:hypothetical protein
MNPPLLGAPLSPLVFASNSRKFSNSKILSDNLKMDKRVIQSSLQ